MSFFEDLKEAYKEIHEYEKNGTCGRELESITAFAEGAKLKIKESDSFVEKTAVVIKPNGKISIVHTDAFSTNDELIEEYERYDHKVISVYNGYVNDSELLSE